MEELLVATVQGFRMLAIISGALVIVDSFKIIFNLSDIELKPKANAISWFIISLCAMIGGVGLIVSQDPFIDLYDSMYDVFVILWIWISMSVGLLTRAAARAQRPRFIWFAALFFIIVGINLTYWTHL